jgi:hypothetical protein
MTSVTATRPSRQPTIRELVGILGQRRGVAAAVLLGRDGLVIDSQAADGVDTEHIAAHVPSLIATAEALGGSARSERGDLVSAVLEFDRGVAVVSALTSQSILVVVLRADAPVGPLLFEIRRHRTNMAAIV